MHSAGKTCQRERLTLTEPICKLKRKWIVVDTPAETWVLVSYKVEKSLALNVEWLSILFSNLQKKVSFTEVVTIKITLQMSYSVAQRHENTWKLSMVCPKTISYKITYTCLYSLN